MVLKDELKSLLARNTYINSMVYSTADKKNFKRYSSIVGRISGYDLYKDVSILKKYRQLIKDKDYPYFTTDANWSNSHIYGIWHSIFKNDDGLIKKPSVEHGLIFHNEIFTDVRYTSRPACVTMSDFRKKIIRSYVNKPVFCVGPYIHYAKQFYDDDTIKKMREENGKTLLVFPTHSTDSADLTVNQKVFLDKLKAAAKGFDTVLINGYWWNINDPLITLLESEGYKIISCGIRDDIHFMERLKSYITISDAVLGDGIGTHVGYAISMNKPFIYIDSDVSYKLNDSVEKKDVSYVDYHQNVVRDCFDENVIISDKQKEICGYYWGEGLEKTDEEISEILSICEDIYKYTKGQSSKIPSAIHALLNRYIVEEPIKYRLLFEAI